MKDYDKKTLDSKKRKEDEWEEGALMLEQEKHYSGEGRRGEARFCLTSKGI